MTAKAVTIDASSWQRQDDVWDALLAAVQAPKLHGRNFNALRDSLTPPFRLVVYGSGLAGHEAWGLLQNLRDLFDELKLELECPITRYDFLLDTYRTERLKILSAWSQVPEDRMKSRTEPRARSPLEHMVHQCQSEDGWMQTMLGVSTGHPVVPAEESRLSFLRHYASVSLARLEAMSRKPEAWFEETVPFFEVQRTRAWVLVRRVAHSAHHRGQLLANLRGWGVPLYSNYGPTSDTGGLPKQGARVIYRYPSVYELLRAEGSGGTRPHLPGPGEHPPTERPT